MLQAAAEGSQATIQAGRIDQVPRLSTLEGALIYLAAAKAGLPVPTANRDEFDVIQQIAPEDRFILSAKC